MSRAQTTDRFQHRPWATLPSKAGSDGSGVILFHQITTADLRAFVASPRRDGLGAASVARHVHAIRSFWRFVVETYDLGGNAALPLRAPKPERRIPDILSEDECLRLLDATARRHYCLYRLRDRVLLKLMMVTGLRRSGVIGLSISDYEAGRRRIIVRRAKGRRWRSVPLPEDLCHHIEAWLAHRPHCGHEGLLTTRTGGRLDAKAIYRALRRLAELAGLDPKRVTPHLLRHAAATHVLRWSGDLVATSRLLGHSSVAVTGDIYCHTTDDDVRQALVRHPLVRRAGLAPEPDPQHALGVPESETEYVKSALSAAHAGLHELSAYLNGRPDLAAAWEEWCLIEAVRHSVRPCQSLPASAAQAMAWEDAAVAGYSVAEHIRTVRLRGLFEQVARGADVEAVLSATDSAQAQAGALGTGLVLGREMVTRVVQCCRATLQSAMAKEPVESFARVLLTAWQHLRQCEDVLVFSHLAANASVRSGLFPLLTVRAEQQPLCCAALEQALSGDASTLLCLLASRYAELCRASIVSLEDTREEP